MLWKGQKKENTPPDTRERVISSQELFENQKVVVILHNGQQYRLMITKSGKLILNK